MTWKKGERDSPNRRGFSDSLTQNTMYGVVYIFIAPRRGLFLWIQKRGSVGEMGGG